MKPYYQDDYATIYHGDCRDILPELPKVELVVTSPPYDNLRDYGGYSWDVESISLLLWQTLIDGAVVVWIVADETIDGSESLSSFRQAIVFCNAGFRLHDTMIWDKNSCRYIDIGKSNAPFLRLIGGDIAVMRLNPTTEIWAKAGATVTDAVSGVSLEFWVNED